MESNLKIIFIFVIILIVIVYLIGVWGYRILFNDSWIDSFFNSAVNITGLNLEVKPVTSSQKIFLTFLTLIGISLYMIFIATVIAIFLEPIILKGLH